MAKDLYNWCSFNYRPLRKHFVRDRVIIFVIAISQLLLSAVFLEIALIGHLPPFLTIVGFGVS